MTSASGGFQFSAAARASSIALSRCRIFQSVVWSTPIWRAASRRLPPHFTTAARQRIAPMR
jgi:hypothetical protein